MSVVSWLRLSRLHTAVLETPIAVIGAAMGLGTLWNYQILGWVLFGVIYHAAGYGMNSYVDWAKGFDQEDPHKQQHPLNTGEIDPDSAKYAVVILMILLIVVGETLGRMSTLTQVCLVIMLVSGTTYNFFGKHTSLKFIPISVVHTMVFVFPYIIYKHYFTLPAAILTCAFFVHHVFQIAVSGDVKDIKQDEASLIKKMGSRVESIPGETDLFHAGINVQVLGYGTAVLEILLAVTVNYLLNGKPYSILLLIALGAWTLYEVDKTIFDGMYVRKERVSSMSRKEIASIWMLLAAIIPVIGYIGFIAIIVVSMAYFLPISKYMWGNWVRPSV